MTNLIMNQALYKKAINKRIEPVSKMVLSVLSSYANNVGMIDMFDCEICYLTSLDFITMSNTIKKLKEDKYIEIIGYLPKENNCNLYRVNL